MVATSYQPQMRTTGPVPMTGTCPATPTPFVTHSLQLAAYIASKGIEPSVISVPGQKYSQFLFPDSPDVQRASFEWRTHQAWAPIELYCAAWDRLYAQAKGKFSAPRTMLQNQPKYALLNNIT